MGARKPGRGRGDRGQSRRSPSRPLRGDPGPRRAAPTQPRCGEWVQPKGFGIGWHGSEKSHNGFKGGGGGEEISRKAATPTLKTVEEPDRRGNRGLGRFAFRNSQQRRSLSCCQAMIKQTKKRPPRAFLDPFGARVLHCAADRSTSPTNGDRAARSHDTVPAFFRRNLAVTAASQDRANSLPCRDGHKSLHPRIFPQSRFRGFALPARGRAQRQQRGRDIIIFFPYRWGTRNKNTLPAPPRAEARGTRRERAGRQNQTQGEGILSQLFHSDLSIFLCSPSPNSVGFFPLLRRYLKKVPYGRCPCSLPDPGSRRALLSRCLGRPGGGHTGPAPRSQPCAWRRRRFL